jgi:hypothetical protein
MLACRRSRTWRRLSLTVCRVCFIQAPRHRLLWSKVMPDDIPAAAHAGRGRRLGPGSSLRKPQSSTRRNPLPTMARGRYNLVSARLSTQAPVAQQERSVPWLSP